MQDSTIYGVYVFDIGGDTYTSTLVLWNDSNFEFFTIGCFTDEQTTGKWHLKGKCIYLYSDSTFTIYYLGDKYDSLQENYIIKIVDRDDKPVTNVECTIVDFDSTINSNFSDKNGNCKLKAKDPIGYSIALKYYSSQSQLWSYINNKAVNYRKIRIVKSIDDFYFNGEQFEIRKNGLQRKNPKNSYLYLKEK